MAWDGEFTQVLGYGGYGGNDNTQASSENGLASSPPKNTPPPTHDGVAGHLVDLDWDGIDDLPFRVIIQPKVENASIQAYGGTSHPDNWMEVEVGQAPEETQTVELFAMAADPEHVGCHIIRGDTRCILYLNTEHPHDHLVLRNCAQHVLCVTQLSATAPKTQELEVKPWSLIELDLGAWAISANDERLVELKVLKRTHWSVSRPRSEKRDAEEVLNLPSKARLSPRLGRVREETLESQLTSNDILGLRRGEKLRVGTGEGSYTLKHLCMIADTYNTRVSRAEHSGVPGKAITVKIIKTANAGEDATVYAAESWMRETKIYSSLGKHFAIAEYLGSDARFHSIYMEHIDAKPLYYHRDDNFRFNGNTVRAWMILSDIAAALSFIHSSNIVHADVKLDNILFSHARGACLIDFGMSFEEGSPQLIGGSPWYLPPEYLLRFDTRDRASDIWALGVVMMWVLGRIPLPESTKSWNVGDLHPSGPSEERHETARNRMQDWVLTVLEARPNAGGQGDEIQAIVNGLVERNQKDRVDALTLLRQIESSNLQQPPL
ncbi:hypothetical protein NUW58_g2521 [Xylaria curta]|uniref:Uncharacterized protein n=1 Tax=Xylaria curta TaxID=42375 RepID=A0ACC1PGC3_9PEZI|nr:hypothetical protein NUW58_g2521 [Xylaria curta]